MRGRGPLVVLLTGALVGGGCYAATGAWPRLTPGVAVVAGVAAGAPAPVAVPVQSRSLICPDVSGAPGRTSTRLAVTGPAAAGGGTVLAAPTGRPAGPALLRLVGAQALARTDVAVPAGAVAVTAAGPVASTVAAVTVSRTAGGPGQGLAEARCGSPARDYWFVGGATGPGEAALLRLVNPDAVPATADVALLSPAGPVDVRAGRGIAVAPRGTLTIPLDTLAPNSPLLATHVRVRAGRLAAALLDRRRLAATPLGVDYVPTGAGPSRRLLVGGVPAGTGARALSVAVPGPDPATVRVEVLTDHGSYVPAGAESMSVRAGSVAGLDLTRALRGAPAGVRLTSDVPIVAGVVAFASGADGAGDLAWVGAGPPLPGAVVVPDVRRSTVISSSLSLTAPQAAATVRLDPVLPAVERGAAGRSVTVTVPAGRSLTVGLDGLRTGSGALGVRVTPLPGSGPVYGTRELLETSARGVLVSLLGLLADPGTVPATAVLDDPAVGSAAAGTYSSS